MSGYLRGKGGNKREDFDNIPCDNKENELMNHIDIGDGSYSKSIDLYTLLIRSKVTTMDQLTTIISDYEKVDLDLFRKVQASWLQTLLIRSFNWNFAKLNTFQFDYSVTSGMQGLPEKALLKLASAKKVCDEILVCIKNELANYGGRLGVLYTCNADCGGTGIVSGRMNEFQIIWIYHPEINAGITTLPTLADGIKFENKQITLADSLLRNFPMKDIVNLQDNNIADSRRPIRQNDFMQAFAIEGIRRGKTLKGITDSSDKTPNLQKRGNGIVMTAGTSIPISTFKKWNHRKVINKNIMTEVITQIFNDLSSQEGFNRYGNVKARCVKPAYIGISGKIPENIVLEAVDSADLGSTLDVLYLPTEALKKELLVFGVYTTEYSIDSLDTFFGLQLDGVRKAHRFDQLVPKDVLEEFAQQPFPHSRDNTDFMTVNERIANICGVDTELVLKTV